jgi:hypothetical protein
MARLRIDYDGKLLKIDGWLSHGQASFHVPADGQVEIYKCTDGSPAVICRDRNGVSKPMRVEDEAV